MSKHKRLSIAVTGEGRLLGMFITDGMQRYPDATWYDRSVRMSSAIENEAKLGESGYLRPSDRPRAFRARRNLLKPRAVDVTVSFAAGGTWDTVEVAGKKRRRTLLFGHSESDSLRVLESYVQRIVSAVGTVL